MQWVPLESLQQQFFFLQWNRVFKLNLGMVHGIAAATSTLTSSNPSSVLVIVHIHRFICCDTLIILWRFRTLIITALRTYQWQLKVDFHIWHNNKCQCTNILPIYVYGLWHMLTVTFRKGFFNFKHVWKLEPHLVYEYNNISVCLFKFMHTYHDNILKTSLK